MPAAYQIRTSTHGVGIYFHAMASPCEVLIEALPGKACEALASTLVAEVRRIEEKFSRYRSDSLCSAINASSGKPVAIDEECYRLLQYADTCYQLSEGLFDISSGVLRRVWQFDGSDRLPEPAQIEVLLPYIGWEKIRFTPQDIIVPEGMEIDFGGIGKEYAVSRAAQLCESWQAGVSCLINFGGDLQITCPRRDGAPWRVGIENPQAMDNTKGVLTLRRGALATSGHSHRYLLKDGVRYGHVLNPFTGWPVQGAPASITVAAELCVQAGSLATIALLQGEDAEDFLRAQGVQFWTLR